MPQKVTDENGVETEVFTAEEVAAAAEAKAQEERARLEQESAATLAEKEKELEAAREEARKLKEKDLNFSNLKNGIEKRNEAEAELKKTIDDLTAQVNAIKQQPSQSAKETFVNQHIAADDKDTREKFDHFYNKLSEGVTDSKQLESVRAAALAAATAGNRQPAGNGAAVYTQPGLVTTGANPDSEASKEFSQVFGLSEEDKKKYGGKKINLFEGQ